MIVRETCCYLKTGVLVVGATRRYIATYRDTSLYYKPSLVRHAYRLSLRLCRCLWSHVPWIANLTNKEVMTSTCLYCYCTRNGSVLTFMVEHGLNGFWDFFWAVGKYNMFILAKYVLLFPLKYCRKWVCLHFQWTFMALLIYNIGLA